MAMSRSNLPHRPSDYTAPGFMHDLPDEAGREATEMALRPGGHEARGNPARPKPRPPATSPEPAAPPPHGPRTGHG